MKAKLFLKAPSEIWLALENDTDSDANLQAVKIMARGPGLERSGAWKPCMMLLGPRMTFRLDVTNLLRQVVADDSPQVPLGKVVEFVAELFVGANTRFQSASLCLNYDRAQASFTPLDNP